MKAALAHLEGKYEIVAKIREGGMGAIYKVRHRLLDEIRVVKVLRQGLENDVELNERFVHEARSAIRLRHPNVVQIFDFLLEGGLGYLVMEYIDGVDLGELIQRRHRPTLPLFLEIAGQSLRALGYLHQKGFVHRDISPDNLMLATDHAGAPLVKMIDLGIAKKLEGGPNLTASGMFLGKFRYSSPEHFGTQGDRSVEPRSDLYSLGVVLYEFLTGHFPIRGQESSQLIAGHLFHPPASFEDTDPGGLVPRTLREVLIRVLDKDPEKRFGSAADFTAALAALCDQFPVGPETLEETAAARSLRAPEEAVRPGSTQNRLDQGFVHPTPAPAAGEPPPPPAEFPPAEPAQVDSEAIEALLSGARTLFRLHQPEQARAQLRSLLQLDPGNTEASHLLEEIDSALAQVRDDTVPWGMAPSAAAGTETPPAAAEPSRDDRQFDHHLHAACSLTEDGNYSDAVAHFEAALEIRCDNETVRQMLSEAREKLDEERRASRERLDKEIARLREILGSGDLDQARERLLSARRAYGDVDELKEIAQDIDRDRLRRELAGAEAALEQAVSERQAGELHQAVQSLERAREAWRAAAAEGGEEGNGFLTRLEAEESALERAHREVAELDEAVYEISSAIETGKLIEADRVLFQALESFGSKPPLMKLREQLDELHHRGLETEVRSMVGEADQRIGEHAFDEAALLLEKARILADGAESLNALIDERLDALAKGREEWKQSRFDALVSKVEELIDAHNLEQAQARLAAADSELDALGAEAFERLRLRIAEGFEERVNALLNEARMALEERRYSAAVPFLEQALELAPGDEWIADRLEQARAALADSDDP